MSPPPANSVPEPNRRLRRLLRILVASVLGTLLLGVFPLPFDFLGALSLGWVSYLMRVVPRIQFNAEIAFGSLIALSLATFGLHRIMRWWRVAQGSAEKWRAGWTLKITAMLLLLFATSIAATGIVHQVGWLFRAEQLTYNAGRGLLTDALSNVKQVSLALRIHADEHEDVFPRSLDELFPKYATSHRILFVSMDRNEPPERIIYFPGYKDTDSEDAIVLASPHPSAGMRVIGQIDGAAKIIAESEFQTQMQRQFGQNPPPVAIRAMRSP